MKSCQPENSLQLDQSGEKKKISFMNNMSHQKNKETEL